MDTKNGMGLYASLKNLMLQEVPSYANKIFYSLGFLSMTSLALLILSGLVLISFGPDWWLISRAGLFTRSFHLWAAQAFIFFILLHLLIVFLTSGYKPPRRLTWVLGALMLFFGIAEAEFGYGLRGDFSSQWRALQASDLYNGSGLGTFVNNLNYAQIYGIHIILIPLLILGLLFLHYLLIKARGIAIPFRPETPYRMVRANHTVLFLRGATLTALILVLAFIFPSPLIIPITIKDVAQDSPALFAATLVSEMDRTSDTATYLDNIDPYAYDTRTVYITAPYGHYVQLTGTKDMLSVFNAESADAQTKDLQAAKDYFAQNGSVDAGRSGSSNPVITVVSALTRMAQSDLYAAALAQEKANGLDITYESRLLSDTGILEAKAENLAITTDQYGMLKEESGRTPGAWWLLPVGILDHTILANDPNQDRDGAEILGLLMLLLIAFPYIPYLNRLPEKIHLDKFIWKN